MFQERSLPFGEIFPATSAPAVLFDLFCEKKKTGEAEF